MPSSEHSRGLCWMCMLCPPSCVCFMSTLFCMCACLRGWGSSSLAAGPGKVEYKKWDCTKYYKDQHLLFCF